MAEGWMSFLSMVAPVALRAMGAAAAAGDYAEADRLRQQMITEYNIPLPPMEELAPQLSGTALAGVKADPRYAEAGDSALGGLKKLSETGFSDQDRAGYDRANMEAANTYSGMMGRNAQVRAARGQSGSGVDTADAFAAASTGADRAYHGGLQVAAQGADRRYQALQGYGAMAERLKQADLTQKNLAASAQDRIAEFNAKSRAGGAMDRFGAQVTLAQGRTGALGTNANARGDRGTKTENTYADVGEGISRGVSAYDEGKQWDDYLKKKYG